MSNSPKAKSGEKAPEGSLEAVFEVLEKKAEALSARLHDLSAANERLTASLAETTSEKERLQVELKKAQSAASRSLELEERLSRHASDRDAVRARIERLIKSLEETEGSPSRPPS